MRMTNSVLPNGWVTYCLLCPYSSYALRHISHFTLMYISLSLPLPSYSTPPISLSLSLSHYLAISFEVLEGGLLIQAHCFHCPQTYDAIDELEGKKEEANKKAIGRGRVSGKGRCGFFNRVYSAVTRLSVTRLRIDRD